MAQIRNKLKKGEYINITDLTADLYLMIDNAKKAFPTTHKVHKVKLLLLFLLTLLYRSSKFCLNKLFFMINDQFNS